MCIRDRVWDNPSKTTIYLGFNGRNLWSSEVGNRVSYFVIAGANSDEVYQGYRLLTGVTHMLPKAVYAYIQSKAIYPTQEQTLDVAREYRNKKLPLDVIVVDFLNMTRQGELDLDPKRWPDPAAMNHDLHGMGVSTLLSVWPVSYTHLDVYKRQAVRLEFKVFPVTMILGFALLELPRNMWRTLDGRRLQLYG